MAKFIKVLILAAIAVVILAFAIANRQIVQVSFDPFAVPGSSTAFLTAPMFIVLFLTVIVGVIIGGIATWVTQGTNRREARQARDQAEHWQEQVRRLRDQPPVAGVPAGRSLARSDQYGRA